MRLRSVREPRTAATAVAGQPSWTSSGLRRSKAAAPVACSGLYPSESVGDTAK